jgi:hypothetical protein
MRAVVFLPVALGAVFAYGDVFVIDGITFAVASDSLFVPIKDVGQALGWEMRSQDGAFFVGGRKITIPKTLPDGTRLVPLSSLRHLGLTVSGELPEITVTDGSRELIVRRAEKRVEISKSQQKLRAYQGDRLVIETHVSTGKRGHTTPSGSWKAGPEKSKMRYSRKYDNSPMPWSVQIVGDVFMHGYRSVPKRPASHGCIRLPLTGINPAKFIWEWIDLGTPITIDTHWREATSAAKNKKGGPETIPVSEPPN